MRDQVDRGGRLGQRGQHRRRADDAVLHLLQHERRVRGIEERVEVERHRAENLEPRDELVQQVGDLARALDEHVEVAARGIVDVFPRLELHLVQPHRREPVPQRARPVGQVAGEPLERAGVRRRLRVHAAHPRHVLAGERDHEVGAVELVHVAWRLRWSGTGMSSDAIASRVRQLIGMPSITCVPDVETTRPGTCSRRIAPAITDRAAFPVHSVTTWRLGIPGTLPTRLRATMSGPDDERGATVPYTLVLLRHGQSTWNLENLFTGWVDVDLTDAGPRARRAAAGADLARAGILPDILHTSLQVRAIHTAELALRECGRSWIPVRRSWRLNERHYGELQGKDKAETAEQFGAEQVKIWRRSYDVRPDPLADRRRGLGDRRALRRRSPTTCCPRAECLKDVLERMLPWWDDAIVPDLRAGATVLVAAHGNSLRALVKHLDGMTPEQVVELNLPDRRAARLRARRRSCSRPPRSGPAACAAATSTRSERSRPPTRWRAKPAESAHPGCAWPSRR